MTTNHADLPGAARPQPSLRALREMLALFAVTAVVWLVHVYGRTLPTAALAVVWAAVTLSIAAGLFWRAKMRRQAFLAVYVEAESPLRRHFRGGGVMAGRQLLLAALLALLLLVALIRLDDREAWVVLVGSVPLVVLAQRVFDRVAAPHVSRPYLPEMTWRMTTAAVGALMLLALVLLAFYRPYPELGAVSLERAVWHFVDQERARSDAARILLQMAAAKDALRLWLAQQLMPQPGASLAQGLGWLTVLAEEAVFVWSYLLLHGAALLGLSRRE